MALLCGSVMLVKAWHHEKHDLRSTFTPCGSAMLVKALHAENAEFSNALSIPCGSVMLVKAWHMEKA